MAQHPIIAQLIQRRIQLRLSRDALSRIARLNRTTLRTWEVEKFTALASLERWASALGYEIVLVEKIKSTNDDSNAENQRYRS